MAEHFFRPTGINISIIKINEINIGSTYTVGQAYFRNHVHSIKRNNGFGEESGDRTFMLDIVYIGNDDDLFDSNSIK